MKELRGALAGELTAELAAPMQALRDRLALLVDHLDRYVGSSTGPTPYPWQSLQRLRHDLGDAYLEATTLVRQLDDLRTVLSADGTTGSVDASAEVETALSLLAMRHGAIEVLADLAATAPVLAAPGELALVVTRLLFLCARSVEQVPGSAISVRLRVEGPAVTLAIADNGRGADLPVSEATGLADLLASWRGSFDGIVAQGRGCSFELHLVTA